MAKKSKTRQVSKKTYERIRLLSAAALVFCAVMAIVVDASDQSPAMDVTSASTVPTSVAPIIPMESTAAGSKAIPDSTYIGCLRTDDDGRKFVLTEIGGPDAPKSRNWKTMFVTKKSGKLEVKSSGSLKLESHVNQTVRLTGKRNEKLFVVRSLRVIGATCD